MICTSGTNVDAKANRIIRFAAALWHGDRGRRGNVEAYLGEAQQIVDALPGLDRDEVIELASGGRIADLWTTEVVMSRGLGALQREIKRMLTRAHEVDTGALRFTDMRAVLVINHGGKPEKGDTLQPTHERSLKRALKGLVDRGDVLIVGGKGGPGDPRRYMTVETFASIANRKKVEDTAEAKQVVAEMAEAVAKVQARGGIGSIIERAKRQRTSKKRSR